MNALLSYCFLAVIAASGGSAEGQSTALAASYPRDQGIGRDKAVLFHDDFEAGSAQSQRGSPPNAPAPARDHRNTIQHAHSLENSFFGNKFQSY